MTRAVLFDAPGPPGPAGTPGRPGSPGKDGATSQTGALSGTVNAGQALVTLGGSLISATTGALAGVLTHVGLAISSVNNIVTYQTNGPFPFNTKNLSAGIACAVGTDASGNPVRVTDPTCVSGLKYLGICDIDGAIYVSPTTETEIRVDYYGIVGDADPTDPSSGTDNSDLVNALIENINTTASNLKLQNTLHFPSGFYRFTKEIGPFPYDMRIYGDALSDQEVRSGAAPHAGGTTFLFTGIGVGVQLGHSQSLNQRNGAIFESIEVIGENAGGNSNLATMSGSPNVTPNGHTYTRDAGSWIADGFLVNGRATFAGFDDDANNGPKHVTNVTATVLTVSETLTNHAATASTSCTEPLYNHIGIEVLGDVGVTVRDCRIGGFKIKLSFDGAEACRAYNVHFDGLPKSGLGYPLADTAADRGADSAFDYRVGSFEATANVDGNGNTLCWCNFNGAGWGVNTAGLGFDNTVRDCVFESTNGMAYLGTAEGFELANITAEGAGVADVKVTSTVYNLILRNVTGTNGVPLLATTGVIYGCTIDSCDCRTKTVPPVSNAANIIGLAVRASLPPQGSGSSVAGHMLDGDPASGGIIESTTDSTGAAGVNCQPACANGLDVLGTFGSRHCTKALSNGVNSDITVTPVFTSLFRVTGPSAGFAIGGLVGGTDGARLTILNTTAQAMTITNEDASSTAKNRITTLTGADVVLSARTTTASFVYDGVTSRWIYVGTS